MHYLGLGGASAECLLVWERPLGQNAGLLGLGLSGTGTCSGRGHARRGALLVLGLGDAVRDAEQADRGHQADAADEVAQGRPGHSLRPVAPCVAGLAGEQAGEHQDRVQHRMEQLGRHQHEWHGDELGAEVIGGVLHPWNSTPEPAITGGTTGVAPAASTMRSALIRLVSSTTSSCGPAKRAWPSNSVTQSSAARARRPSAETWSTRAMPNGRWLVFPRP